MSWRIVGGKKQRRWWQWRQRSEFWIVTEAWTIGPFNSVADAASVLRNVGVWI